jgi:hypothetical protein
VRNPPSLIKLYGKLGRVGKEKMRKIRIISLALLVYGCSANQPITFSGQIVPQTGACDAAAPAVLIKRGHYVQFTPHEGVLILNGQAAPDGTIHASLDTQGPDRKPYPLLLDATLAGQTIAGKYVTPRCRYTVTLRREG